MSREIVFAGNSSYANLGCEAIIRGSTAILRDVFGRDTRFTSAYFCRPGCRDHETETDPAIRHVQPNHVARFNLNWWRLQALRILTGGRTNVHRVTLLPWWKPMRGSHAVLMTGGDNYSLDYGVPIRFFILNAMAAKLEKPYALWGASIGPFTKNPGFERWAADHLKTVPLICARESETVAYLAGLGVESNVRLVADPAFWLEPEAAELPDSLEKLLGEGAIGLNLSPFLARFHDSGEAWLRAAAEIVKTVSGEIGMPVICVPHVMSTPHEEKRDDDYRFMRGVLEVSGLGPDRAALVEPGLSAGQTKGVLGRLRAFAGARTHSTLGAISSGVPTICLSYSMKAKGIAHDVYGNHDWLIDGASLTPPVLTERLRRILDQEDTVRSQLDRALPGLRGRAREGAVLVKRLIEEGSL